MQSPRRRPKYQMEPKELASGAFERGYLSGLEVLRIAAWKNARGLASLTLNSESDFRATTGSAIRAISQLRGRSALMHANDEDYWAEWTEVAGMAAGEKGVTGLMKLEGIDYPMATGILAILDPETWPVLDIWACLTVFGPDDLTGRQLPRRFRTKAAYSAYARHLATQGKTSWAASSDHSQTRSARIGGIDLNEYFCTGRPSRWMDPRGPVTRTSPAALGRLSSQKVTSNALDWSSLVRSTCRRRLKSLQSLGRRASSRSSLRPHAASSESRGCRDS